MPPITTRPAQWADQHRLHDMITALATHHNDAATLDLATLRRDVLGTNPWVQISIATINNETIGYSALCPLMQLQFGARGLDIHHLYVDQKHRNKGTCRALIQDAIKRAKEQDCRYLMIGTAPDNTPAQKAYVACGFTRTDTTQTRFRMTLR